MQIAVQNPSRVIDEFSENFENSYLDLLSRRFGEKRVFANSVYQELIAERHHVHMNSTMWTTLTGFVKYLGRTGKCIVDQTEKGWYIQWIDRDPVKMKMQEDMKKLEKAKLDDEERALQRVKEQVARARSAGFISEAAASTNLVRKDGQEVKVKIKNKAPISAPQKRTRFVFEGTGSSTSKKKQKKKKLSAMEKIMLKKQEAKAALAKEEARKAAELANKRVENWVSPGLIVKVINKSVGKGKYYKKKAVVKAVADMFIATIELIKTGDVLRVDQDDLETVIPKLKKTVKIVNAECRGELATLDKFNMDTLQARLIVKTGPRRGETLKRIAVEDFCKIVKGTRSDRMTVPH